MRLRRWGRWRSRRRTAGQPGAAVQLGRLGKRLVDSILTRDYQVAQGLTILLAAVVVVATLVSSFLYRAADPRVRDE